MTVNCCPNPVKYGLNNAFEYYHMAKEKPKTQETEEQTAIRKEIRKEWGSMEPRLIEMAHKQR